MGPTVWRMYLQGRSKPSVTLASPVLQPPSALQAASSRGPAARWMAASTPPPPDSVGSVALTMASTAILVMSLRTIFSGMAVLPFVGCYKMAGKRAACRPPGSGRFAPSPRRASRPYLPYSAPSALQARKSAPSRSLVPKAFQVLGRKMSFSGTLCMHTGMRSIEASVIRSAPMWP